MDSIPPETPIRDVVDRCRVWESYADPEIRRVSKSGPEPIYPAYMVGESDDRVNEVWVAMVNQPKSHPDPAPVPEVSIYYGGKVTAASGGGEPEMSAGACDSGRACGVGETSPIVPLGAAETRQAGLVCFSCGKAGHRANPWWFLDDFTSYSSGPSSSGKRSLIRGEGFVTRISSNIRPQDPGGGAARLAAPWERAKMDVMNSPEVSVVEPQSVPFRISVVLVEEAKVGGTQRVECPHVD